MAFVRINCKKMLTLEDNDVIGFDVDCPSSGWEGNTYELPIRAWVLISGKGTVRVEAAHNDHILGSAKAAMPRPDVLKKFPSSSDVKPGISMMLGVLGLPPEFQIEIRAVLPGGKRLPLATLKGRHEPLVSAYKSKLRPLMVTMQGRVGSSWLMRLLSEHPGVIVHPPHFGDPFETRVAGYWLHMLKILSDPADHVRSSPRVDFTVNRAWVGHNPFYTPSMVKQPGIQEWFGRVHPERLAAFCTQNIDEFYLRVAKITCKNDPVFFAEKTHADHVPWLAWELYPDAKEIVLIRDFRDMICSILDFNRKRGYNAFGREQVDSDEEYIQRMRANVMKLVKTWEMRADRAFLLRYEELVSETERTLENLMDYLGFETDVQGLVERARVPTPALISHRTVADAAASIGRWKRNLEPSLREICDVAFREALTAFGYA